MCEGKPGYGHNASCHTSIQDLAPGVVKQINPAVEEKSHQTSFKTRGGMTQGLMFHWTLRPSYTPDVKSGDLLSLIKKLAKKWGKQWEKTVCPVTAVSAQRALV